MAKRLNTENPINLFTNAQAARKKADTQPTRKKKTYLRLDLSPQGKNLSVYLEDVAKQMNMSVTKYIQKLIVEDMERNEVEPISQKTKLLNLIDGLSEQELKALELLLTRLNK